MATDIYFFYNGSFTRDLCRINPFGEIFLPFMNFYHDNTKYVSIRSFNKIEGMHFSELHPKLEWLCGDRQNILIVSNYLFLFSQIKRKKNGGGRRKTSRRTVMIPAALLPLMVTASQRGCNGFNAGGKRNQNYDGDYFKKHGKRKIIFQ